MKKSSVLSIITPSFNQKAFITKTIESVISQGVTNLEYIIMDGGSTDGTISVLKTEDRRYPPAGRAGKKEIKRNIFKWVSQRDQGQVDAINKGMKMAKGDIVGYLNSDDWYEKGALKKVISFFQTHPDIMWVTGDCRIVDEKGQEIHTLVRWYKKLLRHLPLSLVLPWVNPITQPSTFWRKEAFQKVGYFDENLRFAFDYDMWLRFMKTYPLFLMPDTLSSFRVYKKSKGGKSYKEQFKEELFVTKRHGIHIAIRFFHRLHNWFIIFVYQLVKG